LTLPNTFSKASILKATLVLARQRGIDRVLKTHIAERLGCATGTINTHWGSIKRLREFVRNEATRIPDYRLLTGRRRYLKK
jgi:AcrR family transcriptional regulator